MRVADSGALGMRREADGRLSQADLAGLEMPRKELGRRGEGGKLTINSRVEV